MRKLKQMAADANAITSPSQDSNNWAALMLTLAAGCEMRWPGDRATQYGQMQTFELMLKDGLNGQSLRALTLASTLQESLNNLDRKDETGGSN